MSRLYRDVYYWNGAAIPAAYFQGLDSARLGAVNGDTGAHNALVRSAADKWQAPPASWLPSHAYALGSFVAPTTANANGFIFKATSVSGTGTSGASEPTWTNTLGTTVTDDAGANQIVWTCYTTVDILLAEFQAFETALAQGINGADGSTHAPTIALSFGGGGLQVGGPTTVARGGTLTANVANGIQLNDNDVPQYGVGHPGRTPTVVLPLIPGIASIPALWRVRHVDGCVQAVAQTIDFSDGNGPQSGRWAVPLRLHGQATVASIEVTFRVGWPHTSVPTTMPGARLLRIGSNGVPVPLTSTAAGADASGFVYAATPSSANLWTGQQSITLTCDQNNMVDLTQYTYVLELVEEQGLTGYPWALVAKAPVRVASAGAILGFGGSGLATVDGVTVAAGDRVLIKDTPADNANGIWIASSGTWSRAADLTQPSDFVPGMLVPVTQGTVNQGSTWQAASTKGSWAGDDSAQTSDAIPFVARGPDDDETPKTAGTELFGHGTIWQVAIVSFTGITQQNFQ